MPKRLRGIAEKEECCFGVFIHRKNIGELQISFRFVSAGVSFHFCHEQKYPKKPNQTKQNETNKLKEKKRRKHHENHNGKRPFSGSWSDPDKQLSCCGGQRLETATQWIYGGHRLCELGVV